jgi:hypothetical protein
MLCMYYKSTYGINIYSHLTYYICKHIIYCTIRMFSPMSILTNTLRMHRSSTTDTFKTAPHSLRHSISDLDHHSNYSFDSDRDSSRLSLDSRRKLVATQGSISLFKSQYENHIQSGHPPLQDLFELFLNAGFIEEAQKSLEQQVIVRHYLMH